eukprot:5698466-Prymnesium_polylepis.1
MDLCLPPPTAHCSRVSVHCARVCGSWCQKRVLLCCVARRFTRCSIVSTLLHSGVCIAQRALPLRFQFLQLRFDGIVARFVALALAVDNWFRGALVTFLGDADV